MADASAAVRPRAFWGAAGALLAAWLWEEPAAMFSPSAGAGEAAEADGPAEARRVTAKETPPTTRARPQSRTASRRMARRRRRRRISARVRRRRGGWCGS